MNHHSIDEVIEEPHTGVPHHQQQPKPTTLESIQEPMETNYTNFGAGRSTDRSINPFPPGQVTVRGILQMDDQVDFHCAQDDVNYADSTAWIFRNWFKTFMNTILSEWYVTGLS